MDGVRLVLIILGLIVILALLGHGLWSIRKNQQGARRNKGGTGRVGPSGAASKPIDDSGFDEYGIGQVRTIKRASAVQQKPQPAVNKPVTAEKPVEKSGTKSSVKPAVESAPKQKKEPSIAQQGLFEDIATTEKPSQDQRKEPSLGAEQIALSFDEPNAADGRREKPEESLNQPKGSMNEQTEELTEELTDTDSPEQDEVEVITLFVSGDIQGAILLQTLTELGLKYGELDIFHRHEDTAGKGTKLFSVADMFNPGVFDLDAIENFTTRGVALFMTLPMNADGHNAFTMMYNAANKIAEAMPRAAVLDGNRNPITKQSVQHTYQKIREFERRQKVTGAAR